MRRDAVPESIRITKVGLWYVLFTLVVGIAATNTGNNALYMVLAVMLATLALSGLLSLRNVRGLAVTLEPPPEVFANRPFGVGFTLANRSRLTPHWFLLFAAVRGAQPLLVPHLPRRGTSRGQVEILLNRRGRQRLEWVHLSSLFPFGFFQKGIRYRTDVELLVFPEVFAAASPRLERVGHLGEDSTRRAGWGHEIHALRAFRPGDDPRGIHWKQSARTGGIVFLEREAERSRRLSILLDNAVGELAEELVAQRFERLVSEAATAALDYLGNGFQVELVTRDRVVPFGGGARQRFRILETLALLEALPRAADRLASGDPAVPQLRLAMEPLEATA